MNRLTIFYFSGTGNTLYVCEALTDAIAKHGWTARAVSIEGLESSERDRLMAETDVMGLAYPTYGSDLPDNMRRFITDLPEGNGMLLAVICTQLAFSGDGASVMFGKLRRNGYRQRWAYQISMPNNLCIPGSPFPQSSDYERHERRHLAKARSKVDSIASKIARNQKRIGDHTPFHFLLAMSQRPAYRIAAKSHYAMALDIDKSTCIECGKCSRNCPSGTITLENGTVLFSQERSACLCCLRCLNFCPVSAVTYKGKVREPHYKGPTKEVLTDMFR